MATGREEFDNRAALIGNHPLVARIESGADEILQLVRNALLWVHLRNGQESLPDPPELAASDRGRIRLITESCDVGHSGAMTSAL